MNYNDPTLRQLLAGKYVLGALQGAARLRFERLLRDDPELHRLVLEWQDDLAPLAQETRAVKPSARVWQTIERRLNTDSAPSRTGLWERLGFWRALSFASATAVIVLALATTIVMLRPPAAIQPSYVAVLQDQTAKPALVVTAYKGPWRLHVESLAFPALAADRVLQVWAVEKGTGTVRPLTVIASAKPLQLVLNETDWKLVKNAESLAVSVEVAGSNPAQPTTPVLFSGLCINLKGG